MYLTIESKVNDVIAEAGGMGRGRPPKSARIGGRSDITIWQNDKPIAIIEVKRHVRYANELKKDISRIALTLREEGNSFRFGLMAFYTSRGRKRTDRNGAKVTIEERLKEIIAGTCGFLDDGCDLKDYSKIAGDDDDAWAACVLHIQRHRS